jgi:hypothetical protein
MTLWGWPHGKLVLGPRTELYNLRDDVSETRDLAAANPAKARELRAALDTWWQDVGAKFPTQNPDFDERRWWAATAEPPAAVKRAKRPPAGSGQGQP